MVPKEPFYYMQLVGHKYPGVELLFTSILYKIVLNLGMGYLSGI